MNILRFFENGPNIPDQLLEKRDQGRVVFLCGAGVSVNAGMPNFFDLTKYVVDFFDPPEGSAIDLEFRPWIEDHQNNTNRPKTALDQIFHLLFQEYGREEVNALVAERLQSGIEGNVQSHEHSIIAKISSDQEGHPQIVTTNFDLLFESILDNKAGLIHEPPAFPNLEIGMPLTGITYLHGRLQPPGAEKHPYVLSSADFGRAYLSEAWATSFIRSLLKSYTVVLVGYQAEDPPVKYLLQGLNHDNRSDRSNLYAFDRGEPEDIEAKWRDRGVTAIAFKDFSSLWDSLEAWAERAENPRQWRSDIIEMAQKGPRALSAHERGQVAHLVRTTRGARLFARAEPPPPAEWLCVFDSRCRVAKKVTGYGEEAESFDPFEEYGLDDDPMLPDEWTEQTCSEYDHLLEWRHGDSNPTDFHRLSGVPGDGYENMPKRLEYLCHWISKQVDSPIAAWWVAKQPSLHPSLYRMLRLELRNTNVLDQNALKTWNLILEAQSDNRNVAQNYEWFGIKDRVKKEGWTPSLLRSFDSELSPFMSTRHPFRRLSAKPPEDDWRNVNEGQIATWEVYFPKRHGEDIDVPDDVLESVFRITEGHLTRFVAMQKEVGPTYFQLPTCYPDRDVKGTSHEDHDVFVWFLGLISRLAAKSSCLVRGYALAWSLEEHYFGKLKLFALNHSELFGADEAADALLGLTQEQFWNWDLRRELLFLICDRWDGFSLANRDAIAERLLNGPDKREYMSDEEYQGFNRDRALRYSQWLMLQGRVLGEKWDARLNTLKSDFPDYDDDVVVSLTEENFGIVRHIGVDETPDAIINLPVAEVAEQVQILQERDFSDYTERRPFTGLVKENPRKALSVLSHLARNNSYPHHRWSELISNWPEKMSGRLHSVLLQLFCQLPNEVIREISHVIGRWLCKWFPAAYKLEEQLAWRVFDHFVSGMISDSGDAAKSGLGATSIGGVVIERSRRTYEHAINSPIGNALRGLHDTLGSMSLPQGTGLPEEFKLRFEHLLAMQGEPVDHAVTITTRQISWLYYLDPEWVQTRVLPWFSFDHNFSEPAWNGYLSSGNFPPHEVGVKLKPLMRDLFPKVYEWKWGDDLARVATEMIVELSIFRSDSADGLTGAEARDCLRKMNEKNRQNAVFRLNQIGQRKSNGWNDHVIPFVNLVWPRERVFKTSNLVSSWVSLLEASGDSFPKVLQAVRQFLVPVDRDLHWLYQFGREVGDRKPLTTSYPSDVLELLDAVIPSQSDTLPHYLFETLNLIEETDPNLVADYRFVRLVELIEKS